MTTIISLLLLSAASLLDASPIVYGNDVKVVKYPFMVYLEISDSAGTDICGGTLIGPRTILTAAHCLDSKGPVTIEVSAGLVHLSDSKRQLRRATLYKKHDNYQPLVCSGGKKQKIQNDIAIVWVIKPFVINEKVQIASLPLRNPALDRGFTDATLTFMGWGSSETNRDEDQLKDGPANAITSQRCARDHNKDDSFICVEKPTAATPCFGDSGGPLLYRNTVIGVASTIKACIPPVTTTTTKKPKPGVRPKKPTPTTTTETPAEFSCRSTEFSSFVNIYRYISWIQANIDPPRSEN